MELARPRTRRARVHGGLRLAQSGHVHHRTCGDRQFLTAKWEQELDYALRKSLWSFTDDRIAVRFQYESHDAAGQWFRSYGNELWEFDDEGLMARREASINDVPIAESERRIFGPRSEEERATALPLR